MIGIIIGAALYLAACWGIIRLVAGGARQDRAREAEDAERQAEINKLEALWSAG
jgi:hypothetical protein